MNKKSTRKPKPAPKKAVKAKRPVARKVKAAKATPARAAKKVDPTKKAVASKRPLRTIRLRRVQVAQTASFPESEVVIAEEFIRPTETPSSENGHRTEPVHENGSHAQEVRENGNGEALPQAEAAPEPIVEVVKIADTPPLIVPPEMATVQDEVICRYNIRFEHYMPKTKMFKYPVVIHPGKVRTDWAWKMFCTELAEHGIECYVATADDYADRLGICNSSGMIPDEYEQNLSKFVKSISTPVVLIGFAGGSCSMNKIAYQNKKNVAGYISLMGKLINWSRGWLIYPLPCRSLTIAPRGNVWTRLTYNPRWLHKWICERIGSNLLILVHDNRKFICGQNRVNRMVSEIVEWIDQNESYLGPKK